MLFWFWVLIEINNIERILMFVTSYECWGARGAYTMDLMNLSEMRENEVKIKALFKKLLSNPISAPGDLHAKIINLVFSQSSSGSELQEILNIYFYRRAALSC